MCVVTHGHVAGLACDVVFRGGCVSEGNGSVIGGEGIGLSSSLTGFVGQFVFTILKMWKDGVQLWCKLNFTLVFLIRNS